MSHTVARVFLRIFRTVSCCFFECSVLAGSRVWRDAWFMRQRAHVSRACSCIASCILSHVFPLSCRFRSMRGTVHHAICLTRHGRKLRTGLGRWRRLRSLAPSRRRHCPCHGPCGHRGPCRGLGHQNVKRRSAKLPPKYNQKSIIIFDYILDNLCDTLIFMSNAVQL